LADLGGSLLIPSSSFCDKFKLNFNKALTRQNFNFNKASTKIDLGGKYIYGNNREIITVFTHVACVKNKETNKTKRQKGMLL